MMVLDFSIFAIFPFFRGKRRFFTSKFQFFARKKPKTQKFKNPAPTVFLNPMTHILSKFEVSISKNLGGVGK